MGKKNTIENITKFINDNSDCILLDTEYLGCEQKLKIKCACGNTFETVFGDFKCHSKRQCNVCGNKMTADKQKLTTEYVRDFIENNSDCILVSGKYDGIFSPLELKCSCGETFTTTFTHFKDSNKRTCDVCSKGKYNIDYVRKYVSENSSSVLLSTVYEGVHKPLKFKCSCGNVFERDFRSFRNGERNKCQECTGNKLSLKDLKIKTKEISECELISSEYIEARSNLDFRCKCGEIFNCSWDKFYYHAQRRCQVCSKQQSKGEYVIEQYLINNSLSYKKQFTFDGCRNKRKLRFDFAIMNNEKLKYLIEFDGSQHYKPAKYMGGEEKFKSTKINDGIKDNYCEQNNIKLVRIPYWKINKLKQFI